MSLASSPLDSVPLARIAETSAVWAGISNHSHDGLSLSLPLNPGNTNNIERDALSGNVSKHGDRNSMKSSKTLFPSADKKQKPRFTRQSLPFPLGFPNNPAGQFSSGNVLSLLTSKPPRITIKESLASKAALKPFISSIPSGVLKQLMSGAFAGVVSRTAVAPLDIVRTHLITGHGSAHSALTAPQIFFQILSTDGWRGLFRGNGINCLRVGPNKAIEFFVFQRLKKALSGKSHPLKHVAATLSGGAAGMAGTLFTYPLELMRTRISVQPQLYKGIHSTFLKIVQEEGVGGLYRGLTPSLLGVFPYAATNYFVYDALRGAYQEITGEPNVPAGPTLVFGALAAAASSALTFPLEVARRQLQLGGPKAQQSFLKVVLDISKKEGIGAVYRGLGTTWLKLIPAAGISFVCYEASRVALKVDDVSLDLNLKKAKSRVAEERKKLEKELAKESLQGKENEVL